MQDVVFTDCYHLHGIMSPVPPKNWFCTPPPPPDPECNGRLTKMHILYCDDASRVIFCNLLSIDRLKNIYHIIIIAPLAKVLI